MHVVTRYFFTFPIYKELYILKKMANTLFQLYEALFIYKKLAADDDAYLCLDWSKISLFRAKADFFVIVNIFVKIL